MSLPSKKLTPTDLMQGAWFALEQCGHLLRDALVLFRADRLSSAVGLAMVARDELGKYRLLLDLWVDAASGKEVTTRNLQESHVKKQKRAALSAVLEGEESEERRAKFDILRAAPHDSAERQRAFEDIGDAEMRKNDRERALYADPRDAGWSRPCNESSRAKRLNEFSPIQ